MRRSQRVPERLRGGKCTACVRVREQGNTGIDDLLSDRRHVGLLDDEGSQHHCPVCRRRGMAFRFECTAQDFQRVVDARPAIVVGEKRQAKVDDLVHEVEGLVELWGREFRQYPYAVRWFLV